MVVRRLPRLRGSRAMDELQVAPEEPPSRSHAALSSTPSPIRQPYKADTALRPIRVGTSLSAKRRPGETFPVSEQSRAFLKRFFPTATLADWKDWRWQLRT